jgi:hypothetical protein
MLNEQMVGGYSVNLFLTKIPHIIMTRPTHTYQLISGYNPARPLAVRLHGPGGGERCRPCRYPQP